MSVREIGGVYVVRVDDNFNTTIVSVRVQVNNKRTTELSQISIQRLCRFECKSQKIFLGQQTFQYNDCVGSRLKYI